MDAKHTFTFRSSIWMGCATQLSSAVKRTNEYVARATEIVTKQHAKNLSGMHGFAKQQTQVIGVRNG